MASWTPPMAFGEKAPLQSPSSTFNSLAPAANYAKLLGYKWTVNGNEYKLIQTTAAFTAAQAQGLWFVDSGTTTKTHLTAATTSGVTATNTLAGLGSAAQIALNIGDYFLVQTAGRATVISGGSTTAVAQTTGASGRTLDMAAPGALANVPASIASFVGVAHATVGAAASMELDLAPIA